MGDDRENKMGCVGAMFLFLFGCLVGVPLIPLILTFWAAVVCETTSWASPEWCANNRAIFDRVYADAPDVSPLR